MTPSGSTPPGTVPREHLARPPARSSASVRVSRSRLLVGAYSCIERLTTTAVVEDERVVAVSPAAAVALAEIVRGPGGRTGSGELGRRIWETSQTCRARLACAAYIRTSTDDEQSPEDSRGRQLHIATRPAPPPSAKTASSACSTSGSDSSPTPSTARPRSPPSSPPTPPRSPNRQMCKPPAGAPGAARRTRLSPRCHPRRHGP